MRRPGAIIAVGIFFTSLSSIIIRLSSAPPLAIASYRMVFATALLLPLVLIEQGRNAEAERHAPITSTSRKHAVRVVLLSVLSGVFLSLHFATWITSLSYTSVASSTVLVSTHPIIVAIAGALILGERIKLRSGIFILLALAGSAVLVWEGIGDGESTALGNLLAVAGAISVSGYMIIGRVVRQYLSVNRYTIIVYSAAAALLIIYAVLFGVPLYPYPARDLLLFLALAVFCTLLGHSLYSWALKYVRPTVISTTVLGEPVIATVLAAVVFAEMPSVVTAIGGVIILLAILLFTRSEAEPVSLRA